MGRRECKRRRAAPVLSGEQHRPKTKLDDKPVQIVGISGDYPRMFAHWAWTPSVPRVW
jgi:hypothetical protein